MPNVSDAIAAIGYRAGMFRLASSVFKEEPTEKFIAQLFQAAKGVLEDMEANEEEKILFRRIASYEHEDPEALLTRIKTEYAELFIGPRPSLAPFFESMYIGYPHRYYTQATRRVRAFYEENGFEVVQKNNIPDDHVGYELEFMSCMCERQIEAVENGNAEKAAECVQSQKRFMVEHLCRWFPSFLERIEKAECSDYYLCWGRYIDGFLKSVVNDLGDEDPVSVFHL